MVSGKNFCTLYLVRHGETEWNITHTIMGHTDSPLTQTGINQAKDTAKKVDDHEKDIKALEDMVKPVVWSNRIVSSVAILLGSAIIALVWQLITGQAQVFFK